MATAQARAAAAPAAPASAAKDDSDRITLEDLVGRSLAHIVKSRRTVTVRGRAIAVWMFVDPRAPRRLPVLGLHGGPAYCHNYILPLQLLAEHGYPVVLYDQCGCGESNNGVGDPSKEPANMHLLTVSYYVEEAAEVVRQLDLGAFYLYGSSWGSMLAMECAVAWATEAKRFPGINSLLRGLILDGTFCDAKTYITTQWRDRLGTYPTFTQNLLKRLTQEERFECKAYKALEQSLTDVFSVRVIPHPLCYEESDKGCNEAIYVQMQGASEFCCGGVLANWTIKERLHVVQVPTLVVRGEYDTMTEEASQEVVDAIKTAWPLVMVPRAAHCKLIDEPQLCCDIFVRFLSTCDATRGR